jgi:hypothetical protein
MADLFEEMKRNDPPLRRGALLLASCYVRSQLAEGYWRL